MPTARGAYIYALEAGFSQVAKNYQVFCQTVGGVFLTFLPKIKDGNSICQTAGDALIIWDGGSTYLNSVGNAISVPSRCYSQVMIASLKGELLKYC